MNMQRSGLIVGLVVGLAGLISSNIVAAPVPVKVNLTNLRCIATYAAKPTDDDPVYLTVTGVARGAEVTKRVPETGTTPANRKKPPVEEASPVTLWEGELADGEFAFLSVTLYQGTGDEAAKTFATKLAEANKGVDGRAKKTLAVADEVKALAAATLKAQQGVVTTVKDTLSREKSTDHFGGLFNILVWNNNGTLVKRVEPVGLTFGEHAGEDAKIYSKIKHTRGNVLFRQPDGMFAPQALPPISEDKLTIRVKMLESDFIPREGGTPLKNVTDYLADIQIHAAGKPVEWKLAGDNIGKPPEEIWPAIKMWWDWAE